MSKKFAILIVALGLFSGLSFTGFGVWRSTSTTPTFETGGYVLQGEADEVKWISFQPGEEYVSTLSGAINFTSTDNGKATVSRESFVHFDDGSMMALSDGILLDFNDLSENFINNYYINAGLRISGSGGTYAAETTTGSMKFGEHLWKLSDQKFMVVAPTLTVHLSDDDVREVSDYVQVTVTADRVVHLLTPENLWMTISEECYLETAGGVKIYPVTQLIDNGTYKLSMAKLSVSVDDAIVLAENETRRQIVPELNIEAIDGEDGQDGEDGRIGQDGEAGEAGTDGEDGQDGEDGKVGADGQTGANGKKGSSGANGDDGDDGRDGDGGNRGPSGKDAVTESTTNSALPTMTISDWIVSATELKGAITVTDNGGLLEAIGEIPDYMSAYAGTVTITNVKTGKLIDCYRTPEGYSTAGVSDTKFDFYSGAEQVYFSTLNSPLEPDTEYKLSVTAYYKTKDQTNLIYSREFISRIFYTDSTGVTLAYETATENSVTISAAVSPSYQNSISQAIVYLLTPAQNSEFTLASISDATKYTASKTISSTGNTNFAGGSADVLFDGLTPNTKYFARVYVETTSGLNVLTNQELSVMTLKRTPTKKQGSEMQVFYNRATGAFEVHRPVVIDLDGGAVSYTYTAYRLDTNSQWVEESKRTITPSTGEPVEFRLQSGTLYRFGVEMAFNDNEKIVYLDLGRSEGVQSVGDTMPKITLTPNNNGVDYNTYSGKLSISLGTSSSIQVDYMHPLKLEFYADQILSETVELQNNSPVTQTGRYTITLNPQTNPNQLDVNIDLSNLYKNTNYSITVTGSLNVGDGNDFVERVIGTVSFRTYNTLSLRAAWSTPSTVSTAFSRTLRLNIQDSQATTERTSYAIDELKSGQVTVELFRGTGTGKLRIAQKNFNQPDQLADIFGSGLEITENDFGSLQLTSSGSYTLTVSEVVDKSYGMNLGYVNDFENILNASEVVSAEPTPPDLLTDPSKGVAAQPIYNKDAATYGGSVNSSLPDDAIVGYTLAAKYDNVQRIGKSITYYAFEYNAFFNALSQGDPIQTAAPLMKMTQPIDDSKDTVPNIALFFGGTKTEDDDSTLHGGHQRYYAGEPNQLGTSLDSGMGRGYRYIFAYTVEYVGSTTGETLVYRTYPYDHREYQNYNRYHGGIKENNVSFGKGVAYILNSGMCEAPVVMPDFHTYVYESAPNPLAHASVTTATGRVTLHYKWRDPDGLIITDLTDKNTKVSYVLDNGSGSQNIQHSHVTGSDGWYEITVPYTITSKAGDAVIAPTVNISEYKLDYSNVLTRFQLPRDNQEHTLANIPLDWSWEQQVEKWNASLPLLQIDLTEMEQNYIKFRLIASPGNDAVLDSVISRAVALKLKMQTEGGGSPREFTLPLTSDVSGSYAKLATGQLGAAYLGHTFTVTQASLLYDTGTQGWHIAEQDPTFALQYINEKNLPDTFAFSNYIGAVNSNLNRGNGALLSGTFSTDDLRRQVGSKEAGDGKLTQSLRSAITNNNSPTIVRYLYPDHMGVDVDNNSTVGRYSGEYAVPKKIGSQSLLFEGGVNQGVLDSITPTMTDPYFNISGSAFTVSPNFRVSGFPGTGSGTIKMAIYQNQTDALDLNTQYAHHAGGSLITPTSIGIGDGGIPVSPVGSDGYPVNDLVSQTKYYIAFYYTNTNVTPAKDVLLQKSDASGPAVYSVTTSGGVTIDVSDAEYRNENYFDKQLIVNFTVSRTFNVSLRYDIFASQDAANESNGTPLLSYEAMKTGNENQILFEPPVLSTTSDNTLKIDLTPSSNRDKLKPGTKYYLKITAKEGENVVGSVVQDFTLTAIGNYGALIYAKNATKDSITYQVTINDPQRSFMGRPSNNYEGALYTVRFTDAAGRLLHTTYDDQVFSSNVMQQPFVLSIDTLKNDDMGLTVNNRILPDTAYQLHVYAVPDDDHNGQISIQGENKIWSDFFDRTIAALKECGANFLAIINGFWNNDTTHNPAQSGTEAKLRIASKSQKTTTEDGWILNEEGVYASRFNANTIRIVFQESAGLVSPGGDPVFRQIDWSATGIKGDSSPVSASGSQQFSNGDRLLVPAQIGGYDAYYFDIPYELGQGNYTIVLQFYENEGTVAATRTITIRSGV